MFSCQGKLNLKVKYTKGSYFFLKKEVDVAHDMMWFYNSFMVLDWKNLVRTLRMNLRSPLTSFAHCTMIINPGYLN